MAKRKSAVTAAQKRAFCEWYAVLGNPGEAARRAGLPPETAERDALHLLRQAGCRRCLARLAQTPACSSRALVRTGLERLAFGSANDIARLVFAEQPPDGDALAGLDLFLISSLKRDKTGGIEIKLFDRQQAMERLLEFAEADRSEEAAAALLDAIGGGGDGAQSDSVL